MVHILKINTPGDIRRLMQEIAVDPYGIKIMLPKAMTHLVKLSPICAIAANILKQQMLSLGAEVAVARGVLIGKTRQTDCLLMGNLSQFNQLQAKLKHQPFGLRAVSEQLSQALVNYQKDVFTLRLGKYTFHLGKHTRIMGIVNVTPDSFSQDGLYACDIREIVDYVQKMVSDGAQIIDIGGESSRPGAQRVSVKEEVARVVPIIKVLAKKIKVPISVDTYKPEVAKQALDAGAVLINDITGLKISAMAKLVVRYQAAVVIMHMQGTPQIMQKNPQYDSLIDDIMKFLATRIQKAREAGIGESKIIVDPGIGFGKTLEHNLEILRRLGEFKTLGLPILAGPSRKSFIGRILHVEPRERVFGTVSACVLAAVNGAKIVRVHDVKAVQQALKVANTIQG